MKLVFVGGGAHRVLAISRSTLALPGVLESGEICLCDLNFVRAEAMGRMLKQSPEFRASGCRITWTTSLDEALPGADVVAIIMPAAPKEFFLRARGRALHHGFISSDNVSPTGALCGVAVAPILMDLARRMERHCPEAWLLNFVNPVAVLSGMINNHTRIRCLGVCAGFTNHLWDIPRLFGRDEEASELHVETAGINHLSFILKGRWQNQDLLPALEKHLASPDWQPPRLQPWWGESGQRNITRSVKRLARFWRELGVLVFSTEGDGMDHLMYDEVVEAERARHRDLSDAEIADTVATTAARRAELDKTFQAWLDRPLDDAFWAEHWKTDQRFKRADEDIFVRIFAALAGASEARVATSFLNRGAIAGIKDHHVVEYTQIIRGRSLAPVTPGLEIPDVVQGLTCGLAAHQTALGDALAHDDPRELARALLSYPIAPYSRSLRTLYRELLSLSCASFSPAARQAVQHL